MNVVYKLDTGHLQKLLSVIVKRLSALTRKNKVQRFKIGITNNPRRRYLRKYARIYDEMLVLYRTTSINYVSQLEDELIKHNWEHTDNKISGGGGDYGEPPYYLYVVRKKIKH